MEDLLGQWPENVIQDIDLATMLQKTDNARYSLIKRVLKSGELVRLKRGLYLITEKTKQSLPDEFVIALQLYSPSFVSFESALSYYGWIPEAVYTITCATTKRAKQFDTPLGVFSYKRVAEKQFYTAVNRIEKNGGVFLIASPWRAIADLIYTKRKTWKSIAELKADLRIEKETLINSNKKNLEELLKQYPSSWVRKILKKFSDELKKNKQGKK